GKLADLAPAALAWVFRQSAVPGQALQPAPLAQPDAAAELCIPDAAQSAERSCAARVVAEVRQQLEAQQDAAQSAATVAVQLMTKWVARREYSPAAQQAQQGAAEQSLEPIQLEQQPAALEPAAER